MKLLQKFLTLFILFLQFFSVGIALANTSGNAQFLNLDLNADSINDRINFGPFTSSTAVVTVTDTDVTGNAWGESVGWINFGPFTSSTAGVKNMCDIDGNGLLSGYAFGENAGWINFGPFTSSTAPTVKIDVADGGKFKGTTSGTGYAWSENYGWIKFDCSDSNSCVTTTWAGCTTPEPMCINRPTTTQVNWIAQSSNNYVDGSGNCLSDTSTTGSQTAVCTLNANNVIVGPGQGIRLNWTTNITTGNYTLATVAGQVIGNPDITNTLDVSPITGTTTFNAYFSGNFLTGIAGCSTVVYYDHCPLVDGLQLYGTNCNQTEIPICNAPNSAYTHAQWLAINSLNYITAGGSCNTRPTDPVYCVNQAGFTPQAWEQSSVNRYYEQINGNYFCYQDRENTQYCPNITPQITVRDWEAQDPMFYYQNVATGNCEKYSEEKFCYNLHPDGLNNIPDNYESDETGRTCWLNEVVTPPVLSIGKTDLGWLPPAIAIIGLLGTIPGFATRLLNLILAIPFYRRKRPWGVVYDSMTKETLDPVYVSVFDADTQQLVDTRITDINGRYGFLLPKGNYYMKAQKTNYEFPSKLLPQKNSDGVYDNLYFGEVFSVTDDSKSAVITLNIPMDRLATDWNQEEKKRMGIFRAITKNTKLWSTISLVLFVLGFIFSAFVLTLDQSTWNVVVFILYVIFALLQITGNGAVTSGVVKDAQGNILAHAVVRVWNANLGTEISKRVTDENGQYYILVAKGDYYITIDAPKPGSPGEYERVFTSGTIRAAQGVINEDFAIGK